MKYCIQCGKKISERDQFCGVCGKENIMWEDDASIAQPVVKKCGQRNRLIAILIMLAIVIVTTTILILTYASGVDLKYSWGTSYSEVYDNETVIKVDNGWDLQSNRRDYIECENPYDSVDDLDGFSGDIVSYTFRNGKLCEIEYEYEEKFNTLTERRDQAEKSLGSKYYSIKHEPAIYTTDVWWIGNTVIMIDWNSVCYCDAEYFQECFGDRYEELFDFFGK